VKDEARQNELGQPVGPALPGWRAPARPAPRVLEGRFCRVEPLDVARHARALFDANAQDRHHRMWTYLFSGPFATFARPEYPTSAAEQLPARDGRRRWRRLRLEQRIGHRSRSELRGLVVREFRHRREQ